MEWGPHFQINWVGEDSDRAVGLQGAAAGAIGEPAAGAKPGDVGFKNKANRQQNSEARLRVPLA